MTTINFDKAELQYAELYKFDFYTSAINGTKAVLTDSPLYLTTYDEDIIYAGNTYKPARFLRGEISLHCNFVIDSVNIAVSLGEDEFDISVNSETYNLYQSIQYGFWDNVKLTISAVDIENVTGSGYMSSAEILFIGYNNSEMEYNQTLVNMTYTSLLDLLSAKLPRMKITAFCNHRFGDSYCGINLETGKDEDGDDIKQAGIVLADSTRRIIYANVFYDAAEDKKFRGGYLKFTSGKLNNIIFQIADQDNYLDPVGYCTLAIELPFEVETNDTFVAYQGCDKSGPCCDERFDNYANFFGFEYVPGSTILRREGDGTP